MSTFTVLGIGEKATVLLNDPPALEDGKRSESAVESRRELPHRFAFKP